MLACLPAVTMAGHGTAIDAPVQGQALTRQLFAGDARGPYATGTLEALWVNDALDDTSTADPDDKRKVLVQVWYPATVRDGMPRAPYAIQPQLYGKDSWIHRFADVDTGSVIGAPVAEELVADVPRRLPVLIYNHGNGNPHFSATFQTQFLASHGYVVVAIGHPGANGIERYPDGTPYRNDGRKALASRPSDRNDLSREAFEYAFTQSDLGLFVQDIGFVIDRLTLLDADPAHLLHQRLDLDRIGALGWSLGGVLSLQAGRDEPRIKAVANLDGWPYGLMGANGVVTNGSARPMLLMFCPANSGTTLTVFPGGKVGTGGEIDAEGVEAATATETYVWSMLRRSRADWYHVTIDRTHHGHFSDVTLLPGASHPADLHPRAAHAIINAYVLAFFNRHVREGGEASPLLSGEQGFPEARLLRRQRQQP